MLITSEVKIQSIFLHKVGNKTNNEGVSFSRTPLKTDEELNRLLINYFFLPFKEDEFYNLHNDGDLMNNKVYRCASEIFEYFADKDSRDAGTLLFDQSVKLAGYLYDQSAHHKIKGGDFFTVYFTDCVVNGELTDAIGLFKSENKNDFIKILSSGDNFDIIREQGIDIKKLDKGCVIYNVDAEKGYLVSVVDNTNRGLEAQYWIENFLGVRQQQNEFFYTQNVLSLCKDFVTKELPEQFEVNKAEQASLLNRSVSFFKQNDNFDMKEFAEEVIEAPEVIESFRQFKENYEEEREIAIADNFQISENAVKKQAKNFKSVIKLDKNFHIYVHGDRRNIEQGEDEHGKYYKLYFKEEL